MIKKMSYPIADLHCDLLTYLALDPAHTPFDKESNCSLTQMEKGGVTFQVLPIYTETDSSSKIEAEKQKKAFFDLKRSVKKVRFSLAFENASGICSEEEGLKEALQAFSQLCQQEEIFYVSLTWKSENRFGGGNCTQIGLKEDGKVLLDFLHGKKIAIDLSHTSDPLAFDILNYLDARSLSIPVIASHSNLRSKTLHARNLPDELVREIIRRKGLIGLNFYAQFLDFQDEKLLKHVEGFLDLGAEDSLCMGADFFPLRIAEEGNCFLSICPDAGGYPRLFEWMKKELSLQEDLLQKIAHQNVKNYLCHNSLLIRS